MQLLGGGGGLNKEGGLLEGGGGLIELLRYNKEIKLLRTNGSKRY